MEIRPQDFSDEAIVYLVQKKQNIYPFTEGAFKLYWPNLFDECLVSLSTGSPCSFTNIPAAFVVTPP